MHLGPIIAFVLFYNFPQEIYTFTLNDPQVGQRAGNFIEAQQLGFQMGLIHFCKRVFECIGVHIYSKRTKSLSTLIWEMSYFWLFFGVGVGYYLFHPKYMEPLWMNLDYGHVLYYFLLISFIFFEGMNLMCHLHLNNFRQKPGDTNIGIPTLHGFSLVSCANYFWEFLAWCIFTITTQSVMSVIFCTVSFLRMNYKAQRRHLRYIAEFNKAYPAEERRAFIPYLF